MSIWSDIFPQRRNTGAAHLLSVMALGLGACTIGFFSSREASRGYLVFLFVLPCLMVFVAASKLAMKKYSWILGAAFVHIILWLVYIWSLDRAGVAGWMTVLFWLSLGFFGLATLLVMRLTSYVIAHEGNHLVRDLEKYPLATICCFLALFLLVTFLLTFALAFHDQSSAGPGLFVRQFGNSKGSEVDDKVDHKPLVSKLWFPEGSARLELGNTSVEPLTEEQCLASWAGDREPLSVCLNRNGLSEIEKYVKARELSQRLRISIVGHANDKAIQSPAARYRSNFELSQARVLEVQLELHRLFRRAVGEGAEDRNIEWFLSPVSNEDTFLIASKPPANLDPKLGVEIGIEEVRNHLTELQLRDLHQPAHHLDLLDYLYFMVYTITTTGYGDIVPITPEAKFITILANLFEVLFIVVFLNVLISGRRGPKAAPSKASPGARTNGNASDRPALAPAGEAGAVRLQEASSPESER